MPFRWRRRLALWAFFAMVATGLMSPLASNTILPSTTDLVPHVNASWQARLALEEGQFPLRVAPLEREGRRYPQFQLYGQLPYTAAAVLQVFLLPDSPEAPYVALKIVIWASLVIAGASLFRLARYLGARDAAALVAAVAYMASPYLLVNLHARGALVEGIAQGLLPLALYQLLRFVAGGGRVRYAAAVLAVTAILLTHLITFAYNLAAAGLLIAVLSRRRALLRLGRAAAVAAGTVALSLYFLMPIVALRGWLGITTGSRSTMDRYRWVTPLMSLLSPYSVPPVPVGAEGLPAFIHPAIGLVSLAGALLAAALLLRLVPTPPTRALRRFAPGLLVVFALGLLLAWSPLNVWRTLPDVFSLAQFTYRLITLPMWSGAVLLALALTAVLPRGHGALSATAGCALVLMASGSYLTSAPPWNEKDGLALVRQPREFETSRSPYSLRLGAALLARPDTAVELPPPGSEPFALPTEFGRYLESRALRLYVTGTLPEPLATQGLDVTLTADGGATLARVHLQGASVEESVPLSPLPVHPDRVTTGVAWSLEPGVSLPGPIGSLRAVVAPVELPFVRMHAPDEAGQGYAEVKVFQRRGDAVGLRLNAPDEALVVLPLEFYPRLLDVQLDDAPAPYAALVTRTGQVLTTVRVPAGKHRLRGRFAGHRAANLASAVAWLGLGLLAGSALVGRRRARP
jgi:6-pyruvoyl-tetrahydropterin synthase related domain